MDRKQRIVRFDIDIEPQHFATQENTRKQRLEDLFRSEQNWLPWEVWLSRQRVDAEVTELFEKHLPTFAWQRRVLAKKAEIGGLGSVPLWPEALLRELLDSLTPSAKS